MTSSPVVDGFISSKFLTTLLGNVWRRSPTHRSRESASRVSYRHLSDDVERQAWSFPIMGQSLPRTLSSPRRARTRLNGITLPRANQCRMASAKVSMVGCKTSYRMKHYSSASSMFGKRLTPVRATIITASSFFFRICNAGAICSQSKCKRRSSLQCRPAASIVSCSICALGRNSSLDSNGS